jgi:hypothetical protein
MLAECDAIFVNSPTVVGGAEEAGCTDEQILTHLHGGGEHYRGCWVIDLLLGKS